MNMRSLLISVLSLLVILPVIAQPVHKATPADQLLREYWAAHPEVARMHDHQNHQLIAEMEPMQKTSDAITVNAAKSFIVVASRFTFTFSPSPFVVSQGDTVSLDITSSDVTHGFFLEQYFPGATVSPGQHLKVTFTANTPGTFTYACTVPSCGNGHQNMVGELIVNAAPTPPAITSFTPRTGPAAGGTVVAISGSNFQNGAAVRFGDASAVSVTVNNSSSINAISPAQAAGDVTITVSNPDGQTATAGTFTYTAPGLTVTSVSPSSGSNIGGTSITISGSTFASGATVTIGGIDAGNVNVVNASSITATTPVGPFDFSTNTSRDVTVTNPDGQTATLPGGFTYTLPSPSITSISPNGSVPTGGTVVISGVGFTTALPINVTFGGVAGTSVHVISPTLLTVAAPAHAVGSVNVVVTVGTAATTATPAFTYQTPSKKRRVVKPH